MSKFKLINILDYIFIFIALFLAFFAWINFFIRNIFLSIFLALFLTCTIFIVMYLLKSKKKQKSIHAQDSQIALTKFKLAIQSCSTQKLTLMLKQLIPNNSEVKIKSGNLHFNLNGCNYAFVPHFQKLDDAQLLNLIRNLNTQNITVFCISFDKQAEYICSVFKDKTIQLIDLAKLYSAFVNKGIQIDTDNIDLTKPKISVKDVLKNSLQPQKSKGYFVSGLVLLFTSIIIPYKIYYVVFSSMLLILSIVCKFKRQGRTL